MIELKWNKSEEGAVSQIMDKKYPEGFGIYDDTSDINRARQYGKTTTLSALERFLKNDCIVIRLGFQALGNASYSTEGIFVQAFARLILDKHEFEGLAVDSEYIESFSKINDNDSSEAHFDDIFRIFRRWCMKEKMQIVLMIDEVDSASDNQVFLDFLAQLRFYYMERKKMIIISKKC